MFNLQVFGTLLRVWGPAGGGGLDHPGVWETKGSALKPPLPALGLGAPLSRR